MIDKDKQDKENFLNKVTYYVFIFFFIAFIIFVGFYLQHQKMQYYKNQDFTTNSASANSINDISNYDTITDLSGTTWLINEEVDLSFFAVGGSYQINFQSNNLTFDRIYLQDDRSGGYIDFGISSISNTDYTRVFENSVWTDNSYRTISILGGSDATNLDLISFLQENATQIHTGYSSTINLTNCTSNKSSESGLSGQYTVTITSNTGYILSSVITSLGTVTYSNDNKLATITIPDVTEDFTITATANLIYHNISYNLGNVVVTSNKPTQIDEISTISITFQPYNNYVLPQYINVEGVTSYQWNKDTGVLTLSNAFDNVDITIQAEYKSGQYTFVELIDSVTLVPVNTFFNLFNFEIFGVNIYSLLLSSLVLFVIIKVILKVFK